MIATRCRPNCGWRFRATPEPGATAKWSGTAARLWASSSCASGCRRFCLRMIQSENRCPSRIKCGAGFFGIMPSRHRRRDEFCKSRAFRNLRVPAFEVRQFRLTHALDSEPAPRKGTDGDIGDRELIALDEAAACEQRLRNAPYRGFG